MLTAIWGEARYRLMLGAVAALGALALLQHWLVDRRPATDRLKSSREFVVTSSADEGSGSLREAIFAADSAPGRARIVLQTGSVTLRSPLPPLVNPAGVVVQGNGAELHAHALEGGAVLDIDSPNSSVGGLTIADAAGQALLIRADGFRVVDAQVRNSDEGIYVAAGVKDLVVERTRFENNRIGMRIESGVGGVILRDNRFRGHRDAAVWAVRGDALEAAGGATVVLDANRFERDRMSVVLGNTRAVVERNEFVRAGDVALLLFGQGAVVRGNRIREGGGIGIFAHATRGAVIEANELDHNSALAVLVRSSRGALVQKNRIYDNGYGIAFVLGERASPSTAIENTVLKQQFDGIVVIGDSPVLRRNLTLNNQSAGLRVLNFVPLIGEQVRSNPLLDGNTLGGNAFNEPVHGDYRVTPRERAR